MQRWEYTFVSCSFNKDTGFWHPSFVNEHKVQNWRQGMTIEEYSNHLGKEGWELVNLMVTAPGEKGKGEGYRLVFKRPAA